MSITHALNRLVKSRDGVTVVEFGLIAPMFLLLIFGSMEIGYRVYVNAIVQGAMQAAGRASGLESGQSGQGAIDTMVRDRIQTVASSAKVTLVRSNYENFEDVGRPEDFRDTNGNGDYDNDECFDDANGNEAWDEDVGKSGQGGANDVALYTATVKYPSFFPLSGAFGIPKYYETVGVTTLRNQPFSTQQSREVVQICPT